jgi:hypothetical protein
MAANAGGNTKRMTVDVHTSKSIEHSKPQSCIKKRVDERITLMWQWFLGIFVVFAEVTVREVCRPPF